MTPMVSFLVHDKKKKKKVVRLGLPDDGPFRGLFLTHVIMKKMLNGKVTSHNLRTN